MSDDELHAAYLAAMRARLSNYHIDDQGCHVWDGYVDRNGYGRVYDPTRKGLHWVHIVSHEVYVGPIPPGHEIDHTCCTPRCIRPACLEAVTKTEHVRRTYERLGKDGRHLMAAELRRLNLTYEEIAEVMGLAGKGSAKGAVESAIRKGLVLASDVPPARKTTASEREDMRDLYALGVPQTVIAEAYGLDSSQVSRICAGRTSGHKREAVT